MYRPRKDAAFQSSTTFLIQDEERKKKEFQAIATERLVRAKVKRGNPAPAKKKPPRGRAGEPGIPMSEWAADKPKFLREDGKPLGSREPLGSSLDLFRSALEGLTNVNKENKNGKE